MRHMLGNLSPNYFERTRRWLMMHPDGGWGSETLSLTAFAAPTKTTVTKKSKVTSCTVSFTPSQDLHGYDSPWPAGGGKNLLPYPYSSASGTYNDVTITKYEDGTVNCSGTASGTVFFNLRNIADKFLLKAGTYIVNGQTSGSIVVVGKAADNTAVGSTSSNNGQFTLSEDTEVFVFIQVNSGSSVDGIAKPMIRLATESDATYAPYSNLCPISGWQGAEVTVDPKYGGLVEWNQIVKNGNFADGTTGWYAYSSTRSSISALNNKLVQALSPNTATTSTFLYGVQKTYVIQNATHKHLFMMTVKPSFATTFRVELGGATSYTSPTISANTALNIGGVVIPATYNTNILSYPHSGVNNVAVTGNETIEYSNVMCFDLTQMFGAGNEPSTVDEFRALFPLDYYAFNAGEVTNVSAVSGLPYSKTSVTFGQTVYGGTADIVSGTGSEAMAEVVAKDLAWVKSNTQGNPNGTYFEVFDASVPFIGWGNGGRANAMCNVLARASLSGVSTTEAANTFWWNTVRTGYRCIWGKPNGGSTLEEFTQFLTDNSVVFVGELATPTPYTFPPASNQLLLQKGDNYNWAEMTND